MPIVTLRYWAAAKEAAGTDEETLEADTLAGALAAALARREPGSPLRSVFDRSSFLLDGTAVGQAARQLPLPGAAVIEVLPPFAGG